jgi:regulator of protease activity HflC (stomatin/prohibitin superfamily)
MQPIQYNEHFEDLMSSDGVPLDFDSIIRLKVIDSVSLIRDFGPNWYEKNVQAEFRNRVRQAVRKHGMNETAIDTKAIDAIDAEVSEAMVKCVQDAKLPLKMMDVTVGKANPPDSIKSQRVETAAQQQRVLTEQQRKLAEDARKQAETSRAASDNAYREAMGMAPNQFIQLENIKMMRDVCKDGKCTFIVAPSSVSPIIDVRSK